MPLRGCQHYSSSIIGRKTFIMNSIAFCRCRLPFCVAEPKTRNQGHSQRRGLVSHVPCLKNVKDLPVHAAAGAFEISWRDAAGGGGAESSGGQ
jgi:hypothetical protein